MSTWRRKALELIPEKRILIDSTDSPSGLWVELYFEFDKAVDSSNQELILKILQYLRWCYSDAAGDISNETHQAVNCGFLEDITRNKKHWPLFKNWFNKIEFENYKGSFQYSLNEKEYKELEDVYYN